MKKTTKKNNLFGIKPFKLKQVSFIAKPRKINTSNLIFGYDHPKKPRKVKGKLAMSWPQAKKKYPKMSPFGDADKDGVKNWLDCAPFDKTRQSKMLRKKIEKEFLAKPIIIQAGPSKGQAVNFPTKSDMERTMKSMQAVRRGDVPPKPMRRLITKKDVIRTLEKNPDLHKALREKEVKIQMMSSFDASVSHEGQQGIQAGSRSLASYRPAFRQISINPIQSKMDPPIIEILKHEIGHVKDDRDRGLEKGREEAELKARVAQGMPTAREMAKIRGAQPGTLTKLKFEEWEAPREEAQELIDEDYDDEENNEEEVETEEE